MAIRFPVISFNAGKVSPLIDARSDIEKYKFACRESENMLHRIYGPAERRPGTKFIDTTTSVAKVLPFIFSDSIAYLLLFENLKLYFYFNGAQVLDGSSNRLEVVTPYAGADLNELQIKQLNDVAWITHPDYPPHKLSRTSATAFTLTEITFELGPFKKRNDLAEDDGITMAPSVTTGNGTLTASSASFESGHVGAFFSVVQPRVNTEIDGSKVSPATGVIGSSILTEGTFTFITDGTWEGKVRLERSIDNSTWETFRSWKTQVQFTGTENELNVFYRVNVISMTSGTIEVMFTVNSSIQEGICEVTGFNSTTEVNITVLKNFASTDADVRWSEGSWSEKRGYPACMTFMWDRAIFAGTPHQPQTMWLSDVGDYEFFFAGTLDDDSFSLTIASDRRNAIQWISALESLLLGTSGGEWRIGSTDFNQAITPSNFTFKEQTSYGSKAIQALPVGDVVLFVDTVGRKLREMVFNGDKYIAPDLSALAEDITEGGLIGIAHQKNPDSILWAVRNDGMPLSVMYEREQKVVAWGEHPMDD